MTSVNSGPSAVQTPNVQTVAAVPGASLVDVMGLTSASQTICQQPVENVTLSSGNFLLTNSGSQNVINIQGGPGVLTQFVLTLFSSANAFIAKGLLFTFTVDGQSFQFDADLWSTSQLPSNSLVPDITSPYVWECDHLICLFGKDSSNNGLVQLVFKYPIPFSSSLQLTIQNQSYTGGSYLGVWLNYAAQMGVSSPRRLQSYYLNSNAPASIPSAVEWQSNYTANGGYLVGQLATYANQLYQCSSGISGGTSAPPSDAAHWSSVSASANPNFNTGYNIFTSTGPVWLAHLTLNGQGPVNGGTYGSINSNTLSFLESNIAIYDGVSPAPSFPGNTPTPTFNSTGTEDFMGGSFYWATLGDFSAKVTVPITVASTPFNVLSSGKNKQLRHGFIVSAQSAFMGANVDLLSLHGGGIRCGTSCVLRWEQGNLTRAAGSGPITIGNTWKINPTVLYYV